MRTTVTAKTLEEWKRLCPYGVWTCHGGRQVMFNRMYWPILERRHKGALAVPAQSGEWVKYKTAEHFFDDYSAPWRRHANGRRTVGAFNGLWRVNEALREWGMPTLADPPPAPKRDESKPLILTAAEFLKEPIPPRGIPWENPETVWHDPV